MNLLHKSRNTHGTNTVGVAFVIAYRETHKTLYTKNASTISAIPNTPNMAGIP